MRSGDCETEGTPARGAPGRNRPRLVAHELIQARAQAFRDGQQGVERQTSVAGLGLADGAGRDTAKPARSPWLRCRSWRSRRSPSPTRPRARSFSRCTVSSRSSRRNKRAGVATPRKDRAEAITDRALTWSGGCTFDRCSPCDPHHPCRETVSGLPDRDPCRGCTALHSSTPTRSASLELDLVPRSAPSPSLSPYWCQSFTVSTRGRRRSPYRRRSAATAAPAWGPRERPLRPRSGQQLQSRPRFAALLWWHAAKQLPAVSRPSFLPLPCSSRALVCGIERRRAPPGQRSGRCRDWARSRRNPAGRPG